MILCRYDEPDEVYPEEMLKHWKGSEESFRVWKKAYAHWRNIALTERAYWEDRLGKEMEDETKD